MALELPLMIPNLGGYVAVRYEDILQQGMEPLVQWLSDRGIHADHTRQAICANPHTKLAGPQSALLHQRQNDMPTVYKDWIAAHAHAKTERLLGYFE